MRYWVGVFVIAVVTILTVVVIFTATVAVTLIYGILHVTVTARKLLKSLTATRAIGIGLTGCLNHRVTVFYAEYLTAGQTESVLGTGLNADVIVMAGSMCYELRTSGAYDIFCTGRSISVRLMPESRLLNMTAVITVFILNAVSFFDVKAVTGSRREYLVANRTVVTLRTIAAG